MTTILDRSFCFKYWIWGSQERFSSIITPKNLTCVTHLSGYLSSLSDLRNILLAQVLLSDTEVILLLKPSWAEI